MTPKTQSVCKRILFVDDHEVLARLSVEIMEMNGYGAESASTAAEAIQKAESGAFDVVVSDCKLDDMSGLQLAKRLPALPFIIFSGYAPVECKDNVIASLSKEDLFPALLEKLKKILAEPVAEPASTGEPPMCPICESTESPHAVGISCNLAARPSEPSAPACDWPFEGCCTQKELCLNANRCLKNLPASAAPQPVAGEGPRGITDTYAEGDENPNNIHFTYPLAEGTPKLEEAIKELNGLWFMSPLRVAETLRVLRLFITPACSPEKIETEFEEDESPRTPRDLAVTIVDLCCGYTMEQAASQRHHRYLYDRVTSFIQGLLNFRATPASTGEAQALLVIGDCYKCPACKMPLSGTPEGHLHDCVVRRATETNLKNDGWISPYEVSTGEANGELERLRELREKATHGNWCGHKENNGHPFDWTLTCWAKGIVCGLSMADCGYISHALNYVEKLLAPSSVPPPEIKVKTVTPEELEREQNDQERGVERVLKRSSNNGGVPADALSVGKSQNITRNEGGDLDGRKI